MNKRYRKVIIAGNWKMNKLPSEVKPFIDEVKALIPEGRLDCQGVLCLPATHISSMKRSKSPALAIGAQNISHFDKGAHTGEISADMLLDLGTKYCIVGHSERRADNNDTDEVINAKIKLLLSKKITPILCVGESLDQRDKNLTIPFITYQLKAALSGLAPEDVKKVVIAYEPIWAIGTGRTATNEQAQEVCFAIREVLRQDYNAIVSRKVSILYGGSMNPGNCEGLLAQPDIDGGLIGGASLKPADFAYILNAGHKG